MNDPQHYQRIKALYPPDDSIQSFTESVFIRPGMYTINGTLEEVGAFLEGFYSGMASHNRDPSAKAEAQRWFDFLCMGRRARRGRTRGQLASIVHCTSQNIR